MSDLKQRLDDFLAALPVCSIAKQAAGKSELSADDIEDRLQIYINETRVSFDLVRDLLSKNQRILEVGAGLCLLSLFLKREGYDVYALEPAIGGFELFNRLKQIVLEQHPDISLQVIEHPAQQLSAQSNGSFDFIFSNNVLEHIPDWQRALVAMLGVLVEGGCMVHACPNYSVPYEPHYGVPVLRRFPALSRRLFLPPDADTGIWDSLNFISHRQVRCFARQQGCSLSFCKGLIYQALARIQSDPLFRERHKGLVASVAGLLSKSGLLKLMRYLPPAMSTPMIFSMQQKKCV